MAKLSMRPTRNTITAVIALAMMMFFWKRARAPMILPGGIIASPPQLEDTPSGKGIVKFKNIKKLPSGDVNLNNMLVDTRSRSGKNARIYLEDQSQDPYLTVKPPSTPSPPDVPPQAKIAKVSMLYRAISDPIYEIAMGTQEDHAAIHDYPMHVLRREIVPSCKGVPVDCNSRDAHNLAGMWNKELYLLSLLTAELTKPKSEQMEWLMWQDGDTITVNPSIPLDIFLPPENLSSADDLHFLATKDDEGFTSGVFFLRVSPWSVRFLTGCLAVPVTADADKDLGWSYDQSAMDKLLQTDAFKSGVAYQPRRWYNAYGIGDMYPPEQKEGDERDEKDAMGRVLNVHFPGMTSDERRPVMQAWLTRLEQEEEWEIPVEETGLLKEIESFWNEFKKKKEEDSKKIKDEDATELKRAKES